MKIRSAFLLAITSACSLTAYADTQDIKNANNQFIIQGISTNFDYTETGDGRFGTVTGTLDTESGYVPGFAVSLSVMKDLILRNDYLQLKYSRNSGNTNYVGQLQGGTTNQYGSVVQTDGATVRDYSLRWGKGIDLTREVMITPYLELGHHEWDRAVNSGEYYSNAYLGIGAMAQFTPVSHLVLTADLLLGQTYNSHITVNGTDGFSGALGNSSLSRIGIRADYAFTRSFHGNVGLDYTSFQYGSSATYQVDPSTVAWEPGSKTNYTTVSVGVGYSF